VPQVTRAFRTAAIDLGQIPITCGGDMRYVHHQE
jgi:hypothetical protein